MQTRKQSPSTPDPPFYTVRQFAARSGLSEKAIRELVRIGAVPFILCGNRAMLDVEGALQAIRLLAAKGDVTA